MVATATIRSASGEDMAPADTGKLEYNHETDLNAKSGGTVVTLNMQDYYEFDAGATLMVLENNDYDSQIQSLQDQIKDAQESVDDIKEQLSSLEMTAPFDGTVVSCNIVPGQTVEAGTVVMSIANLSDMVIEAQVNEADISKVSVGLNVTINQDTYDGQKQTMGTIQSISMQGKNENGVSFFPVIVSIDNSDGSVMLILADWAQRILTLRHVDTEVLVSTPWPFQFHIILGMTIFLLLPFSRLVHVWSGFAALGYLLRPYQVVRSRRLNVPAGRNLPVEPSAGN
jgi:multidrug efflux pump subunit AcrA (membrane-fusion protein)